MKTYQNNINFRLCRHNNGKDYFNTLNIRSVNMYRREIWCSVLRFPVIKVSTVRHRQINYRMWGIQDPNMVWNMYKTNIHPLTHQLYYHLRVTGSAHWALTILLISEVGAKAAPPLPPTHIHTIYLLTYNPVLNVRIPRSRLSALQHL